MYKIPDGSSLVISSVSEKAERKLSSGYQNRVCREEEDVEMDRKITHGDGSLLRSDSTSAATTSSPSSFVLQWGSRKRLRCMKVHHNGSNNDPTGSRAVRRVRARVDRWVVRSDINSIITSEDPIPNQQKNSNSVSKSGNGNAHLNLRPSSPSHRILRNSESSIGMRGHSNGRMRGLASPDRKATSITNHNNNNINIYTNNNSHHHNHTIKNNNINIDHYNNDNHQCGGGGGSGSSETAHDGKKGGSSGSGDTITAVTVWPPKFVIALTNKEKEEDFMAIKGSRLPQRPKKRAKLIQRTLNLVSPGAWLCDLTLERYEVREKKVSKKRPRGLKAMGNMGSDSE